MWTDILGYLGAFMMGISLGLIGGGGSIFSVPILVYLFNVNPIVATAYSLFVVGITSLTGSVNHIRLGNIRWKAVFFFGIPSIASVFITRSLIIPMIPDPVHFLWMEVSKPKFFLLIFALFMLAASYGMMRKYKDRPPQTGYANFLKITTAGLFEGFLTGLVGAGGGFLIIPSLVLLGRVPMKEAIGSSLLIIAVKSLMGFSGDLHNEVRVNWGLLLVFAAFAIAGIMVGSSFSRKVSNEKLKPIFGYFVLLMAIIILVKELLP